MSELGFACRTRTSGTTSGALQRVNTVSRGGRPLPAGLGIKRLSIRELPMLPYDSVAGGVRRLLEEVHIERHQNCSLFSRNLTSVIGANSDE